MAVVITEAGIALNPNHKKLSGIKRRPEKTSLKLVTIEELRQTAEGLTGTLKPIECTDKITCIVEYRTDGSGCDSGNKKAGLKLL